MHCAMVHYASRMMNVVKHLSLFVILKNWHADKRLESVHRSTENSGKDDGFRGDKGGNTPTSTIKPVIHRRES